MTGYLGTGYGAGLGTGYGMGGGMLGGYGSGSCCCNFPTLVILILIVLQFSRVGGCCDDDGDGHEGGRHWPVGNGILFIIALFFLACCNPCKSGIGAY